MKIKFKENGGIQRINEPVTFGIPLPEGHLRDGRNLSLIVDNGIEKAWPIPFGHKVISTWADNSIKWLLVDIQVSLGVRESLTLDVVMGLSPLAGKDPARFQVHHEENRIKVCSPLMTVSVNTQGYFHPFESIAYQNREVFSPGSCPVILKDAKGEFWHPFISKWNIEHDTRMRKTLYTEGRFKNERTSHFLEFFCRTHFFCEAPWVKIEFTIRNSRSAVHLGGAWDLGDENSFLFKGLKFQFSAEAIHPQTVFYSPDMVTIPIRTCGLSNIEVYQDSSGCDNWQSKNHMNREGKIPLQFKGYRVSEAGTLYGSGDHASPVMGVAGTEVCVYSYAENFWQNFPKTMAVKDGSFEIELFPEAFGDLFELQPGEQKTHVFYLGFGEKPEDFEKLKCMADPLVPEISCEDYYQAMTGPRPVPAERQTQNDAAPLYDRFMEEFVNTETGYRKKNIRIDEFGWRNFGDIYADHEAVAAPEGQEFISHYNNQYDVIKGALFQFMRTGKREWFRLAQQLADHVVDIDIYHTQEDKYQYNGGLFWHTDHHLDAHTATHRTISQEHRQFKPEGAFGGGPYPEHNYATGLLYLYWMTGHPKYRDAVIQLSDYIVNWLQGPDTLSELTFQTIRDLAKKLKSLKGSSVPRIYVFDGPCRASGNSLNTLLDGWLLTHDARYLNYAESLIAMAVHPDDDPDAMDLLNAEIRWFYTVFLQALGRYLDIKSAFGQIDDMFHYGRRVLIHYAEWMLKKEYPYLEKPEILEFPNETWATQDLRKSDIFAVASFYAGDRLRKKFEEKSHFFFEHSLKELSSFETLRCTRPMALVMSNAMPFMEMDRRNKAPFDKEEMSLNSSPKKASLLNPYLKNILDFSFKREKAWIRYQVQSILKRKET